MSREELLVAATGLLFAVNAWFLRRLVTSIDEFKHWVREKLEDHDRELTTMAERHRLEDIVGHVPRSHHGVGG